MTTKRKLLVRALLVPAVLGVLALATEGLLRAGVIPNARAHEVLSQRFWREADARVVILGDSFFVPYGLTGKLVERELRKHGVAVRNLAVSGTGPFEYLARLRNAELDPEPDLVLLSYYAGNDLTDVQDNPKYDPKARGTAIRLDPPPDSAARRPWYARPYLFDWLRGLRPERPRVPRFPWDRFLAAGMDPELVRDAQERRINPYLCQLAMRNPNHLLDNILMESERNQEAWRASSQLIARIQAQAERRGARLCAVIFPRSIQVEDSHFEFFRKLTFRVDPRTLDSTRPQDLMAELCQRLGIPLLDLLPDFRAHAGELFLEKDDHLNREGHHFAAERIVPFVLQELQAGAR